ncbi:MOP flippase family protein [Salinimicrobium sp. WS361]|uniref:MOP flippase family protein n=1 Tax=Salinimicrobium sp. WS361 TaxID=3425123 RepID=UPI003D6DF9FB
MPDNFKKNTLSGISWSLSSQILKLILKIAIGAVLARLLLPEDYGLIGMITVATGFLFILKDFGFGAALVQKKNVEEIEYDSVFWLNVIIGIVLALLVFFCGPLISYFYEEPKLIQIARVISVSFILNSILIVPNNILYKKMRFKNIFIIEFLAVVVSGSIAIVLAYFSFSYWSLVAQNLSMQVMSLILVFYFTGWKPRFRFSRYALAGMKSFSMPLIADASINYWVRNVDYLLIGKVLGKADLGYYSKAYTLMLLPVRQLSGTITKVMFPSFSLIQDEVDRIGVIYLKISGVIGMISFPLMGILFFASNDLILFLYGNKWIASVPIFKVLCVLGAFQSISTLSGNIYLSQGKTKLMLQVGIFTKTFMILGITIGLFSYGLMGLVYGYTITSIVACFIEWRYISRLLNLKPLRIYLNILPYFVYTLISIISLKVVSQFVQFENHFLNLTLLVLIGSISYVLLLVVFKPKAYQEAIVLIKEKL